MKKIVYIIPGFHGSVKMVRYRRVIAEFQKRGFEARPIIIDWNRRVMSDYVAEFLGQVNHSNDDEVYLFGFSFGAMIAFIAASKINPKVLILGSLSPFFMEDLKFVKKSWKRYLGKNRLADLKNFSFDKAVEKNKKYKMYLLVGGREDKTLLQKAKKIHQKIKKSEIIIIDDARHNIKDKKYLKEITGVIEKLGRQKV